MYCSDLDHMLRKTRGVPTMSLRETAALEEIRSAIAVGDLGEDRIFSAAGLAKTLGMSLSPVREAMMSLVSDGTVEAVPNRGYRLVPVTRADLDEILPCVSCSLRRRCRRCATRGIRPP